MEKSSAIEQKIKQTFDALEGITPASPQPYFYTRLHARLEREFLQPKTIFGLELKPIYALSLVIVVIIINFFALATYKTTQHNRTHEESYRLYEAH
jgi:hypothetical protein